MNEKKKSKNKTFNFQHSGYHVSNVKVFCFKIFAYYLPYPGLPKDC